MRINVCDAHRSRKYLSEKQSYDLAVRAVHFGLLLDFRTVIIESREVSDDPAFRAVPAIPNSHPSRSSILYLLCGLLVSEGRPIFHITYAYGLVAITGGNNEVNGGNEARSRQILGLVVRWPPGSCSYLAMNYRRSLPHLAAVEIKATISLKRRNNYCLANLNHPI